jgi:hypothetical protein
MSPARKTLQVDLAHATPIDSGDSPVFSQCSFENCTGHASPTPNNRQSCVHGLPAPKIIRYDRALAMKMAGRQG